jgi:2-polyprenyl-3-methyl-5-hydroxy-6-metoxy-1,4-benzoquinol methylase
LANVSAGTRKYTERGVAATQHLPAEWLVDNEDLLAGASGRRALDVACGDGRNAGYLAALGLAVGAVHLSDVAIDALRAAVAERGVPINPLRVDLTREPLPAKRYDVVVQFSYLQRSLFSILAEALVPGRRPDRREGVFERGNGRRSLASMVARRR